MFGDVAALDHEVGDEAVEGAALVPEPEFPRAKGSESESPFYSKIAFCLLISSCLPIIIVRVLLT